MSAQILKRCDVTDYKTFDTSAKAAKMMPPKRRVRRRRKGVQKTGAQKRELQKKFGQMKLERRPKLQLQSSSSHLPHDDDEDEHADAQWAKITQKSYENC